MSLAIPADQLWPLALVLVATGLVVGLLASIFGVGGGAISVPVLHHFFGVVGISEAVSMHVAVGTSLAIIVPTSIASFLSHRRRGAVDDRVLRGWLVTVPLGAVAAALVASSVTGEELRAIFAVLATLLGIRLLVGRTAYVIRDAPPEGPGHWAAGFGIGLVSTLMGIGGGILSNTWLTLHGRPLLNSIATSSGVGVLIAIPGTIAYAVAGWGTAGLPPLSLGYVNLVGVALIIPIATLVTPLGVAIAHRLPARALQIGFGAFLLIVAAHFAATLA